MRSEPSFRRPPGLSLRQGGGVLVVAGLLMLVGCGNERGEYHTEMDPSQSDKQVGLATLSELPSGAAPAAGEKADMQGEDTKGELVPQNVARKVVYNATVSLVVEDISKLEQKLAGLVKETGAYLSESDVASASQVQRTATWKVRVPVLKFDSFLASVVQLGELQRNHLDSQDVTQEYYDVEARIANKQKEEKRLQKHLDESTGKLEDILAVERELSRVRGEIEHMQGRIRYLANVSSLSTVTITATEIKNYKPPQAPTFATQIARTFSGSVENLTRFGKGVVLFLAALLPWIPIVALLVLALVWLVRRGRARVGNPIRST